MAKWAALGAAVTSGSPPEILLSISDSGPQIFELRRVNEECINQNGAVTVLTTVLETVTVTGLGPAPRPSPSVSQA